MTSGKKSSSSSGDFLEYMASFKNLNGGVLNIDSSSSESSSDNEVEIVNEFKVSLVNHRCDLCCEGEFLINKMLRFGGLIDDKFKFVCDKCDKNFVLKSEMSKHSSQCTGPVSTDKGNMSCVSEQKSTLLKCTACSKTFKSKGGRTKHMNSQHQGPTRTCALCEKVFPTIQKFRNHCAEHHMQRRHYTCKICQSKFHAKSSLRNHSKEVHNAR